MSTYTGSMTLEQIIGQTLCVGFDGLTPTPEISDLIQHHHVGNIIFFSRNVQDTEQLRTLTASLQKIARDAGHTYPLIITIDQENGTVQRLGKGSTAFPGNMALGAAGSEQLVYEVGQASGQELKALGITMNFAPVVDVNNNAANPVIGTRSYGEDPQFVARCGAAAVNGLHSARVMTTLKHFPGHGDTAVDSHLALPLIPYDMERLNEVELVPFKHGIAAGTDAIMTAHIAFPAITHDETLPATLSPAILSGILREQLGFEGIIITDCLEMNAISEGVGIARGSVMALQAGADLVLISHLYQRQLAALTAIREAVEVGELALETVKQAAERVMQLKASYLSWEEEEVVGKQEEMRARVGSAEHQELSRRAYEQTTTLVRNEEGLIPLKLEPEQQVLVVYPQQKNWTIASDRAHALQRLAEGIKQRHENTRVVVFDLTPGQGNEAEIIQATAEADVVIVATINAMLNPQQAGLVSQLLETGKPIIGVAAGIPYDLLAFPQLKTYVAAYEYMTPAIDAVVRVLLGEVTARGHLPVTLPGISGE
jgi:beta-N-acetylhexosaminidase